VFGEQARALADGGADLLVLETFLAIEEALWAAEAIAAVTDLPLVMSFSFDQGTRTMMGLSAADIVAATEPLGLAAGRQLRPLARRHRAAHSAVPGRRSDAAAVDQAERRRAADRR